MRACVWPRSSCETSSSSRSNSRDVAVDRLLELAVGAVAAADLLERLLPLQGVEPAREDVAFAALVALPQLGRRVVIDHARDIDRERVERFHRLARLAGVALRLRRTGSSRPARPSRSDSQPPRPSACCGARCAGGAAGGAAADWTAPRLSARRAPRRDGARLATRRQLAAHRLGAGARGSTVSRPWRATMRLSSASASICSTITRRICAALSAVSCGSSRMPRRSSVARLLHLALHRAAHLAHLAHDLDEALADLAEQRRGLAGRLLVDRAAAPRWCACAPRRWSRAPARTGWRSPGAFGEDSAMTRAMSRARPSAASNVSCISAEKRLRRESRSPTLLSIWLTTESSASRRVVPSPRRYAGCCRRCLLAAVDERLGLRVELFRRVRNALQHLAVPVRNDLICPSKRSLAALLRCRRRSSP